MIRSNRFISNISLFTTIFLFILTVSLGLVFYYMNKSQPAIWLIGTLFIGIFLAFIISISNMNKLMVQGIESKSNNYFTRVNKHTKLTSCPDYWTKNVAYDYETNLTTTMCYNELPNSLDDVLLAGELIRQSSTDGMIFVFSEDSNIFANKTLEEVRDMAVFTKNDVYENFDSSKVYRRGDAEYEDNYHKHNDIQHIMSGKITTNEFSRKNVDSKHSHNYTFRPTGHSHNSDMRGSKSIQETLAQKQYVETYNNLSNWISPYELPDGRFAIEINMNLLNKADNSCELAKNFIWSNAEYLCIKSDD